MFPSKRELNVPGGFLFLIMPSPKTSLRPRTRKSTGKSALVGSRTTAKREASVLRRGRERLAAQPRPDETSARTTVAARRTSRV